MKRTAVLVFLAVILVVDAFAWRAAYRAATAPPPEAVQSAAAVTPLPAKSPVEQRGDGLALDVSLNGPWRYRQTGTEMAPPSAPTGPAYADRGLDDSGWRIMELPKNWYLGGLNYHGVIWFRRAFRADPGWQDRAIRLRFAGADYQAEVWLNGQRLGQHTGSFEPFTFDVSGLVDYDGDNVLAVRVESPADDFSAAFPHHKTLVKGIFQHAAIRPGNPWGASGQEYNTGGVWGDISLLISDFVTVDRVLLDATWPTTVTLTARGELPPATLRVRALLTNDSDHDVQAEVELALAPRNFEGSSLALPPQTVTLTRGRNEIELSGQVAGARAWQPWDRGAPNLYTARLTAGAAGAEWAAHEVPFGFRQIRIGDGWAWTLNGQRFFPRGAGYVSSQWLSQVDRAWLEWDLKLIRDANLNAVRLPAHVETPAFYDLANEAGLLVWQDFPLQWGYSDAPQFVDEAQRQMSAMIGQLYNHPSIVVWSVHNETPWDTPALGARMEQYDRRQNKRLDDLLFKTARDADATRFVNLNSGGADRHIYAGWDAGAWQDYADLPGAPFVSEYGAQALPDAAMLSQMLAPEEMAYASGEVRTRWEFHGFQPRQTFDVAEIDPGNSLTEFIANSQAYQANLLKFATESYRRAKYDPMQGIFQFLLTDCWPAISWSVLDYDRNPKPGYYALQTAMQPVLPSIGAPLPAALEGQRWVYRRAADLNLSFWVVNDTLTAYPDAMLRWRFVRQDLDATLLEEERTVAIGSDEARSHVSLSSLDLAPGSYVLELELVAHDGAFIGRNTFEFAIASTELQ